jgi:hypothetical protein
MQTAPKRVETFASGRARSRPVPLDPPEIVASADRAKAGRDIRVTNIYKQYIQAPASLASRIRTTEFQALIGERTRTFVGRDFILEAINGRLADPSFHSGYIVIQGEPGIGKTALMAHLVLTHDCPHHFNIALQNIRTTAGFLDNMCAQLIVKYGLRHDTFPEDARSHSGFLNTVLHEAANASTGKRVIIVVDALDEAEPDPSGVTNPLMLPPSLPDGVIFIVTARPKTAERLVVDHREDLYLREDDLENLQDVRRYIEAFIAEFHADMELRSREWEMDLATFIDTLINRSEGNFMYLVHVLRDIRMGRLSRSTVNRMDVLPKGLRAYYQQHWRLMQAQDRDRFERYYSPVVCMLATVREAVAIDQVQEWTGIDPMHISAVINEWIDFLNVERKPDGGCQYRVYHASFQDFLREEVGLTHSHEQIVAATLRKIGLHIGPDKRS